MRSLIDIIDFTTEKFGSMFAFLICLFFIYQLAKQKGIRECWKNEYKGKRKFEYIIPLKKKNS